MDQPRPKSEYFIYEKKRYGLCKKALHIFNYNVLQPMAYNIIWIYHSWVFSGFKKKYNYQEYENKNPELLAPKAVAAQI